jgi:hypothetical protein
VRQKTSHGNLGERLAELRARIAALQAEIERVEQAPIPRDEAVARVPMLVDGLAQRWTPVVSDLMRPAMPSVETIFQGATSDPWTLGGVLAKVARDGLVAVLTQELEALYLDIAGSCIPSAERPARLRELRAELLENETTEETVIVEAARAGIKLNRRGDADPRAVLSVPAAASAA